MNYFTDIMRGQNVTKIGLRTIRALVPVVTLLAASVVHGREPKVPTVSIEPEAVHVVLGQPVVVNVLVRNETSHSWIVDWGGFRSKNLTVYVSGPNPLGQNGEIRKKPMIGDNMTLGGPDEIKDRDELRRAVVLDSWVDFDQTGRYKVTVRVPIKADTSSETIVVEGEATIDVSPAASGILADACEELATKAVRSPSVSAILAGEALSHIDDEACLPSLVRVLDESFFAKTEAVIGIAEIGTEEAISVLVSRWEDLGSGLRARAEYELTVRGHREALDAALVARSMGARECLD